MVMSHLSPAETDRLGQLSHWVREVFSERAHHIVDAIGQDPSFAVGEAARSTLARLLMRQALAVATSQAGVDLITGPGGCKVVRSLDGSYDRRYRSLLAKRGPDGNFLILSSSNAILDVDLESFFIEETWVLGYTLDLDNQIDDLFVAEVLDRVDGSPGRLVLGPVRLLGDVPPTSRGFRPSVEFDLPGFEDDADAEENTDVG